MVCKKDFNSLAKNRIEIQSQTRTADGYGGFTNVWTTSNTVWSIIYPFSGKEIIKDEHRESNINCRFVIRYLSGLSNTKSTAEKRIKFNLKYFNILSIQNVESFEGKAINTKYIEGKNFQILNCEQVQEVIA